MGNNEKKNIIVLCSTNENHITVRDCIKVGFGFYIGWTAARTLKYLLLAKNIKKD